MTQPAALADDHPSSVSASPAHPQSGQRGALLLGTLLALVVASTAAMFFPITKEAIALAALASMLGLLLLRVPVAFALWFPSLVAMYAMTGFRRIESTLGHLPYQQVASWSLTVIPMFVLMGLILANSGVTNKLYAAARSWMWWLPGGLAVGTNFAGAGLAAVTGSAIGTTYALARVGIPEMLRAGYSKRFAVMSVMSASLPGQLIPPSVLLVVYAGVAETPVGPQLIAGIGPGLLVCLLFSAIMVVTAIVSPRAVGRGTGLDGRIARPTGRELWSSLVPTWPVPLLMLTVVVGMFTGFFTATEAGAAAALAALIIGVAQQRRNRPMSMVKEAAVGTVSNAGQVFLLLIGAMTFTEMLTQSGVTRSLSDWVTAMGVERVGFLLIMTLVYLILGTVMDSLSMILVTVPLLLPTLAELDISLLWFGIFVVLMAELALLMPPTGILTFVLHSVVKDPRVNLGQRVELRDIFLAVAALVPGVFLLVLIMIFFPEVVTMIPDLMSNRGE